MAEKSRLRRLGGLVKRGQEFIRVRNSLLRTFRWSTMGLKTQNRGPVRRLSGKDRLKDQDQREAQTKQKKEFDDLIKKLEGKKINGVEFECKGEWLTKGYKLRVTTVPQPTEAFTSGLSTDWSPAPPQART